MGELIQAIHKVSLMQYLKEPANGLALPAAGEKKARKRETAIAQKSPKNAQSPSRPVHALLACVYIFHSIIN